MHNVMKNKFKSGVVFTKYGRDLSNYDQVQQMIRPTKDHTIKPESFSQVIVT
jgi:hypothetical protein